MQCRVFLGKPGNIRPCHCKFIGSARWQAHGGNDYGLLPSSQIARKVRVFAAFSLSYVLEESLRHVTGAFCLRNMSCSSMLSREWEY